MEKELQNKIGWYEQRHAKQSLIVEDLESRSKLDRSDDLLTQLRTAKKEKLRLKDHIEWLKKLENQLQKN